MHKTLKRQVERFFVNVETLPKELEKLFGAINEVYEHFDDDRALIERSLELSSREMEEINNKLKKQNVDLVAAKSATEQWAGKMQALLTSIGDGVVATDKEGKITVLNLEAESLLGWRIKEIEGKLWSEVLRARDENGQPIADKDQSMHLALSTGQKVFVNISNHHYYQKKNGDLFPIANSISPVVINNEITGVVMVFKDITKDTDIDRAKNEFVSLASHQLRTPLSTVKWYAELLLAGDAGKVSDDQKKYLEEIYTGNQRMIELVNALLSVSRIDLGTFIIDISPTDLREVCEIVLNELKPQIKEQVVRVEKFYSEDLPIIPADPKLVKIILQNLLSNSIKYTPANGEVKVTIEKQENDALITVSDTGYGIPESQQHRVFTKMFRADNVMEKDSNGTGLGLYVVKSIVEQSGGKIWFKSAENKGTSFYIMIPLSGMKKKEGTRALI